MISAKRRLDAAASAEGSEPKMKMPKKEKTNEPKAQKTQRFNSLADSVVDHIRRPGDKLELMDALMFLKQGVQHSLK